MTLPRFSAAFGREPTIVQPSNQPIAALTGDERDALLRRLVTQNAELDAANRALLAQRAEIADLRDATERAFMVSVTLLAKAAELHDEDTGNHILRLDRYAGALARRLGMPLDFCSEIDFSASLHDVGKMSVDSALLRKRGSLTAAERQEMQRHTEYGYRILRQSDRLGMAAEIAWCHHERWDGLGYPRAIAGEAIPLAARIVAVADVYDALRSPRPYKGGQSHRAARDWILAQIGQFDPAVLAAFESGAGDFEEIYEQLVDRPDQRG